MLGDFNSLKTKTLKTIFTYIKIIKRRYEICHQLSPSTALFSESITESNFLDIIQQFTSTLNTLKKIYRPYFDKLDSFVAADSVENLFNLHNMENGVRSESLTDQKFWDDFSYLYHNLVAAYQSLTNFTGNIDAEFIKNIESILSICQESECFLGELSDAIARLPEGSSIQSHAFSLGRQLEYLQLSYEKKYQQLSFTFFRKWFIDSSRIPEIIFARKISLHKNCDDKVRYALIKVMINKIEETTSPHKVKNSYLRQLLLIDTNRSMTTLGHLSCYEIISNFVTKNELDSQMPEELKKHLKSQLDLTKTCHIN